MQTANWLCLLSYLVKLVFGYASFSFCVAGGLASRIVGFFDYFCRKFGWLLEEISLHEYDGISTSLWAPGNLTIFFIFSCKLNSFLWKNWRYPWLGTAVLNFKVNDIHFQNKELRENFLKKISNVFIKFIMYLEENPTLGYLHVSPVVIILHSFTRLFRQQFFVILLI